MGAIGAAIAAALAPYLWRIVLGAGIAIAAGGAIAGWSVHQFNKGYARAVHDVATKNQEAVDAVDKVRAGVRACNATDGMRWDQVAGECVRRD